MTRVALRAPLLAAALASMAYGVWLGLERLGWPLPLRNFDHLILHGPLMIGGFIGTLIGLERAIGFARWWAYAAPVASAVGVVALAAGHTMAGPILITIASASVSAVFIAVFVMEPALFSATMLAGSVCWFVGNLLWTAGFAIYRVVLWWIAFIVLTIAGERLELNRLLRPRHAVRAAFVAAALPIVIGSLAVERFPSPGVRIVGSGLLALSAWLGVHDIARRTIRQHGVTRYIAVCLLSGYAWLGVGGAIAIWSGAFDPGFPHDAFLHAVFLGFAVSMIFGHAPIVFPTITGRPLVSSSTFYGPLVLLHASVAIRVIADLVDELARYRARGGLLNAAALLLFVVNTVAAQWPLNSDRA